MKTIRILFILVAGFALIAMYLCDIMMPGWVQLILVSVIVGAFFIFKGKEGNVFSTSDSDIPNYKNWDKIYDSLSGEVNVIGPIVTKEKAIEQFYKDYERTKRAFAEEQGFRRVADMDKTYISGFFKDMETSIRTGQVEFDNRSGGEFFLRYRYSHGWTRTYHHWPYRKYTQYDMIMWRGEINDNNTWLRYGLSNETHQQYWRTYNGTSCTGIDASYGEVE